MSSKDVSNRNQKLIASTLALYGVPAALCSGAIVYSDASFTLTPSSPTAPWDIDSDGNADFLVGGVVVATIQQGVGISSNRTSTALNGQGWVQNASNSVLKIANLATGFSVGSNLGTAYKLGVQPTSAPSRPLFAGLPGLFQTFIQAVGFSNDVDGYAGFKFSNASGSHYGWASFTFSNIGGGAGSINASLTVNEWAYNTVADAPIQVAAVPEPAETATAIGLLALGAAGVHRWRKNRAAKTTA